MDVVRFVRTVTQFCGTHEKRKSLKIKHKQQQGNESAEKNNKIHELTDGQQEEEETSCAQRGNLCLMAKSEMRNRTANYAACTTQF